MDDLTIVALAPFYSAAVVAVWFGVAWMIRTFNESAVQTKLTETVPKE